MNYPLDTRRYITVIYFKEPFNTSYVLSRNGTIVNTDATASKLVRAIDDVIHDDRYADLLPYIRDIQLIDLDHKT